MFATVAAPERFGCALAQSGSFWWPNPAGGATAEWLTGAIADGSEDDVQQLRELAEGSTPVGVMSPKLGRSEDSIRAKAQAEGISLSPLNRSPYGTMS